MIGHYETANHGLKQLGKLKWTLIVLKDSKEH